MKGELYARAYKNDGRDAFGRMLEVGQDVVKAYTSGRSSLLEVRKVIRVDDGGVTLDGDRPAPLHYSGRVAILPIPVTS